MTLAKVKEQDGLLLAKVKEQDGMKHHGADASVKLHAYCTLDML